MNALLVAGAINTDLIAFVKRAPRAGETVAGGHFEQHGGGKGANQAMAAARSGSRVVLLSAVGNDDFGMSRLAELTNEGIDVAGVASIESVASGVAVIVVEENGENRICDLPGARERLTSENCLDVLRTAKPDSILATNELPQACLEELFRNANDSSIPVWFNVAPFSEQARELIPYVNTLIVNRGEAEDILRVRGNSMAMDDLVSGLRKLGVTNIIITLGEDGVRGIHNDEDFRISANAVKPIDTTGAGDTFCGAWAAEMMRGSSFADSLAYANIAASIAVTRRGAQSSIPSRDEVTSR